MCLFGGRAAQTIEKHKCKGPEVKLYLVNSKDNEEADEELNMRVRLPGGDEVGEAVGGQIMLSCTKAHESGRESQVGLRLEFSRQL